MRCRLKREAHGILKKKKEKLTKVIKMKKFTVNSESGRLVHRTRVTCIHLLCRKKAEKDR